MSKPEVIQEVREPNLEVKIVEVAELYVDGERLASHRLSDGQDVDFSEFQNTDSDAAETLVRSGINKAETLRSYAKDDANRTTVALLMSGGFGAALTVAWESAEDLSIIEHSTAIGLGAVSLLFIFAGVRSGYRNIRYGNARTRRYTAAIDALTDTQ